jgi:predicted nucleic acid-binding protein
VIIVDTNVALELMADKPSPQVIAWLDGVEPEDLWLTAITIFEIKGGIDAKPKGRRKQALIAAFDQLLLGDFQNQVLSFDLSAALHAARIDVDRQKRGRPAGFADTQIAGIAASHAAAVATRNVRHFDDLAVPVINPWDARRP